MLAQASGFRYAPEGGRAPSSWASLRAAAHSMIRSRRKNGTANITGSCISGGSTSENALTKSTATSLAGRTLPEAEHLTAPCRPDMQVDVGGEGVLPIDQQAGPIGLLVRQPLRLTVQPAPLAVRRGVAPAGLISSGHHLAQPIRG